MILQRLYDDKLAQAGYLIGCAASGEALVIDPLRDAEVYLAAAARERVRITHVTETHIHADFVSGARELTARTGARLYLSAEGGPDWQYGFAREDGAHLLRDGDHFEIGNIRIDVVHTPGHTPEHLTFVVTDAAADAPIGAATGDFLFVGDVGRPDLLEKAAGVAGTMDAAARTLFHSLHKFRDRFPDWLQIWPGHGAGSACGKGLSSIPHSTLGYEARFNWALSIQDEDEFVRIVLAGQPEPPRYFAQMKRINRDGPRVLGRLPRPEPIEAGRLEAVVRSDAVVVDTRKATAYADVHVPGTLNIPLNRSFTNYAGSLLPYDAELILIVTDPAAAQEAVRDLSMIGLDDVRGFLPADAIHTWASSGGHAGRMQQTTPDQLAARAADVAVIDVRARSEYDAGHLPASTLIPLPELPDRLREVPTDVPVVFYCDSGGRSAIAASLLQARGYRNVSNLTGGYRAWARSGRETSAEVAGAR